MRVSTRYKGLWLSVLFAGCLFAGCLIGAAIAPKRWPVVSAAVTVPYYFSQARVNGLDSAYIRSSGCVSQAYIDFVALMVAYELGLDDDRFNDAFDDWRERLDDCLNAEADFDSPDRLLLSPASEPHSVTAAVHGVEGSRSHGPIAGMAFLRSVIYD